MDIDEIERRIRKLQVYAAVQERIEEADLSHADLKELSAAYHLKRDLEKDLRNSEKTTKIYRGGKEEIDRSDLEKKLKAKEEARKRVLDRLARDRYDLVLKDIIDYDIEVDNSVLRKAAEEYRGTYIMESVRYSLRAYRRLGDKEMIKRTEERRDRLYERHKLEETIEAMTN